MKQALLLLAALLLPALAAAQTKEQDIDALLDAVQLEQRVAASNRLMRAAFIRGMRNRSSVKNPRLHELIEEEYDATFPASRVFADVKPEVAQLFADQFSQREVRELTAMFRGPVYAKYRELNDDIGKAILQAIQASVKAGMGDLMKRVTDRAVAEGVQK
jgi:hypothetical protein